MDRIQELLSKSRNIWIVFFAWTLFASNLWLPRNWGFYGSGDWDLTYSTFEVARINIIEYKEWPSYQVFLAFGSDSDANPQSVGASIFLIPVIIFGTFYGYKVSILIAMLIGLWGAFKLFKLLCADNLISISLSIIFAGAAYFSRHIFEAGHSNFLFFYFLPWIFYHLENYKNFGLHKYIAYISFLLALPIAGGAPLLSIIASAGIFLWSLGYCFIEKKEFKYLLGVTIAIAFSLILNAWKILPAIDLWSQSPRLANDESGINLLVYLQTILDFQTDTKTPHQWHEFAIGFPIILLFFSLYKLKRIDKFRYWLIIILPIFWIGLGNYPIYFNPWYILNHFVPVFSSLRAPYRISVLSLLLFCVLFLKTYKFYKNNELIYIILVSLALTQSLSFNSISNQLVYTKRIEEINTNIDVNKLDIVKFKKQNENQFIYTKNQCIVQNAYEPLALLEVHDSIDKFIIGGNLLAFKPDHFEINSSDSIIKTSIRFNKNWRLNGVGKIVNWSGLLCIEGAKGKISLEYKNDQTRIGALISLISLIIFMVFIKYTSLLKLNSQ